MNQTHALKRLTLLEGTYRRRYKAYARRIDIERSINVSALSPAEHVDLLDMMTRANAHAHHLIERGEATTEFHRYRNDALKVLTDEELERLEAIYEKAGCEQ